MYSPKIAPDVVRELYRIRVAEGIPMTRLVDRVLRDYLKHTNGGLPIEKRTGQIRRATGTLAGQRV